MQKSLTYVISFFIGVNIFLGAWYVLHHDILFHTDIARDFMVLQDIVKTHKPTLIGPRAGGIPGVFHGPLWFYINLPAFIVGHGNPIVVGWFWVLLTALSTYGVYYSGKTVFNKRIGMLGALLFSTFAIVYTPALFNSFGSVALFPLFFCFFRQYQKTLQARYLAITIFLAGLLVQFQVGFGGIMVLLTFAYLIPFIIKKKKFSHFMYFPVILIPLSTFLLFELRHNFFEIRSVITYLSKGHHGATVFSLVANRFIGSVNGLRLTAFNNTYIRPALLLFIFLFYKVITTRTLKFRADYMLYIYFYFGFWLSMLAYNGTVWGFFHWSFLPVTLLVFSSAVEQIPKQLFATVFLIVFLTNLYFGLIFLKGTGQNWNNYYTSAKDIYKDADSKEFGYYVYSPDLLGYSEKYAISYTQQEFPATKSYLFQKKPQTYLTFEKAPDNQPWLSGNWWAVHQVNITTAPVKTMNYQNGFVVKKYILSSAELTVPSDPNLVQDLIFR